MRGDITPHQRRLLSSWLDSRLHKGMTSPFVEESAAPAADMSDGAIASLEGRYELANNVMLTLAAKNGRLLAYTPSDDGVRLVPIEANAFLHPTRNARLTFALGEDGTLSDLIWIQNGRSIDLPRLGPLVHKFPADANLHPGPMIERVRAFLHALAAGESLNAENLGLTQGAATDYAQTGPVKEFSDLAALKYLGAQSVADLRVERHGASVQRVEYYSYSASAAPPYVMVYVTEHGLITDIDLVNE